MPFRKWLILLCALAGLSLPAMSANSPEVTITFWHAMRGDKEAVVRQLCSDFENLHPTIKVDAHFVGAPSGPYGSDYVALYRGLLESLASHHPPDLAQMYEGWTTEMMDYGYLVPPSQYFDDSYRRSDVDDFVPIFLQANRYNDTVWSLPFNKSIYVMYCNQRMLDAAHVTVPKTWEELRVAARKLTAGGHRGIVMQPNVDWLGHWLYAQGGEFLVKDHAAFDGDLGVAAAQYWVDLVNTDKSALSSFDPGADFLAGKAALYIYSTSAYAHLSHSASFPVRVAPLPTAAGKKPRVQFAGTNLAIFKTEPSRQQAACKFIQYLTSPPITVQWALHTGYLPVRQSAIDSVSYREYLSQHPDFRAAAVDGLRYACVQPRSSAWEAIRGIIDDAMFEAVSKRSTPRQALTRAGTLSNDLIQKLKGTPK